MADSGGLTSRPSIQSRLSQQSIPRKLASSPTMSIHRRIGSDDISLSSKSQGNDTPGFTRPTSVSPESQQRLPIMGTFGTAGSSTTTTPVTNWIDDSDLGARSLTASPQMISEFSQVYHRPDSVPNSRAPSTHIPKSKPAPMQFEDVPMDYQSPAGSSQPMFSPRERFRHSRTDSGAKLLNTPSTTAWRSPRTPPPYTAVVQPRKWWHWRPAWFMYVAFFFGVACAIGHHIFYNTLSGKPAKDQIAMLRYGTVLAFAAKAGLVASAVVAFRQRIWVTVRNKFLSVAALDSLFAATEDVSALLNVEIFKRAKIAVFLAAFVWLTPIVIILTSNTLTVEPTLQVDNTTCPGIRTLNFTRDELEEWRTPTKIDGWYGLSMSLWNTTSLDTSSPDWFDYYTAPTNPLYRVATQAAYSGQAVSKTSGNIDVCGSGWNCTYTINFTAPAYKCSELASGVGSAVKPLGNQQPPNGFTTDLIIPKGDYSYYAYTGGGDYSNQQMKDTGGSGIPSTKPPFPETLGAFRTEPVIWIAYAVRKYPNDTPPVNKSASGWNDAFIPKVVGCEHYEADYTVLFNWTGGQQITNVTKRDFLHPIIDTTWIQGKDANDGTNDNTTATPKSNYVYPRDLHNYRRVAAFHSMGIQLRDFVNGTIDSHQLDNPIENTKADQTKLLNLRQDYFAYPNLVDLVQDFYEDMILSLFSNQQFVSVVWAAKPNASSGTVAGDETTKYPCMRSRLENRYAYHVRDLWIVYSIAILLAIIGVAFGTMAVLENEGVLRTTRFSSIVAATRGPSLEKLGWVAADDKGDLPSDLKNLKVGYGIVHRASGLGVVQDDTRYPERVPVWDSGDVRYGFGLEGDVRQLRTQARREGSLFRQM
ncbi:uncharacterized protein F4822DRAFT_405493 [Hypoxylon trugodes]|uniref:uncharacterized protein n=1 Tax=Hypoxylon trugodes TaxID=326681 RepID=UPI002197BA57|nr:uncharacterized protein F4822DRAFT_405493 [Hypoxylon trugodes]KAI1387115.1 hypothetical protein F4822DRAFT_405493 [Hypoxylon trugodes]